MKTYSSQVNQFASQDKLVTLTKMLAKKLDALGFPYLSIPMESQTSILKEVSFLLANVLNSNKSSSYYFSYLKSVINK